MTRKQQLNLKAAAETALDNLEELSAVDEDGSRLSIGCLESIKSLRRALGLCPLCRDALSAHGVAGCTLCDCRKEEAEFDGSGRELSERASK
jgi:predicted amidophosphoribosyltransferase